MAPPKRKTDPNHKATFSIGVCCRCSCGWSSSTWYGKGAKSNAAGEWHGHRDRCEKVPQLVKHLEQAGGTLPRRIVLLELGFSSTDLEAAIRQGEINISGDDITLY